MRVPRSLGLTLEKWAIEVAQESGLDPAFAEKFLNFIVAEVIRHHEHIRGLEAD